MAFLPKNHTKPMYKQTSGVNLNQFGRRNLSNYQRSVLALEMENVFSEKAKVTKIEKISQFRQTGEKVPTLAPTEKTREQVAKAAKVSHGTLDKVKVIQAKEQQVRKPNSVCQISDKQKIDTKKELAKTANVSHDTIAKAKANQAIQYKGEISLSQISVKVKPIDTQKEIAFHSTSIAPP